MRTTTLRQSGGSIIVSLPKTFVEQLGLGPNAPIDITLQGESIVIAPQKRKRIGLKARLAQCDFSEPASADDAAWLDEPSVGRERIDG